MTWNDPSWKTAAREYHDNRKAHQQYYGSSRDSRFKIDPTGLQQHDMEPNNRATNIVDAALKAKTPPTLQFTRLDEVEAKHVEWLWHNRLARGKLTLLAGEPGIGKSQTACDIGARISKGTEWPDSSRAPRGSVIVLSAEDSANDTLRPRFEAADADLTRIHVLQATLVDVASTPRNARRQADRSRPRGPHHHRSDHQLHGQDRRTSDR
jgi:RecA-family ATPase